MQGIRGCDPRRDLRVHVACNVFSTDVKEFEIVCEEVELLTWGRIDEVLCCAFDLFRLAMVGGKAGHRSERIGQWADVP